MDSLLQEMATVQAWGDYTTKIINYDCNYFVLLGMRLQLQLQYLSKVIN